ncbi:MAG: Crp/Fnr family transcriptional regulator [Candidatus Shapirobacteria bacterium]|nr:Crp/Fnr family transcriptional regulator [Candidatus Shapirobacteria bacterium]MDD4410163.1 Crp/Fnr family transcriptional regulator [Candidatus Shapirobacteria bacterium]
MNEKIKKQFELFFSKFETIKYKKGQILFRPGENLNTAYIEKSGLLRAYIVNAGKETSLPNLRPLFFCAGMNGLYKKPNRYFVEAITTVELWAVPMDEFVKFIEKDEKILNEVNKKLIDELLDLSIIWRQIVAGDAKSKVAGLICMIAKEVGEEKGNEILINFNTPHRVMASIAGLTRETVTLQILKFQKQGYLYNKKRKMVIKNIEKIKEIAKI